MAAMNSSKTTEIDTKPGDNKAKYISVTIAPNCHFLRQKNLQSSSNKGVLSIFQSCHTVQGFGKSLPVSI